MKDRINKLNRFPIELNMDQYGLIAAAVDKITWDDYYEDHKEVIEIGEIINAASEVMDINKMDIISDPKSFEDAKTEILGEIVKGGLGRLISHMGELMVED